LDLLLPLRLRLCPSFSDVDASESRVTNGARWMKIKMSMSICKQRKPQLRKRLICRKEKKWMEIEMDIQVKPVVLVQRSLCPTYACSLLMCHVRLSVWLAWHGSVTVAVRCFALLLYEYLSRRTWFRFGFWCSMLMLMLMLTLIANGAQLPYGKLMRSAWQCWSVSAVKCGMILEFNSDSVAWEDRFSMLFVLCSGMLCCVQSRSRLQLLHHSAVCSDVMWRELSWHC